jgi:two-component system, NarL family, response regulator LiaR
LGNISVIVADSQPAFREGLCRLMMDNTDLEVVGMAADGEEAVRLVSELKPDVAVIDIALRKMNGIEATRRIKTESPETAVLIVTSFNYHRSILSSLRAGAAGYLPKDTPTNELVAAVRLVHAGDGIIDRESAQKIVKHVTLDKAGKKSKLGLYPRELEVLKLTAKGLRNKEIARDMNISERTVQAHLSNIFGKLNVDSRTEAVLQGLKEGWLDISDLT